MSYPARAEGLVNSIRHTTENWRVEQIGRGKRLDEVKIQKGIFQEDAISQFLFEIAMMPLSHTLRKCTGGYTLHKLQKISII